MKKTEEDQMLLELDDIVNDVIRCQKCKKAVYKSERLCFNFDVPSFLMCESCSEEFLTVKNFTEVKVETDKTDSVEIIEFLPNTPIYIVRHVAQGEADDNDLASVAIPDRAYATYLLEKEINMLVELYKLISILDGYNYEWIDLNGQFNPTPDVAELIPMLFGTIDKVKIEEEIVIINQKLEQLEGEANILYDEVEPILVKLHGPISKNDICPFL